MNKAIMMLALAVGLAVVFYACKNDDTQTAPSGTGKVSGTVNDSSSGAPLSGVTITAQTAATSTQSWTTEAAGTFSFSFSTDSTRSVTLTFSKSGYRTRNISTEVSSGVVTSLNVGMSPSTPISGGTSSGSPATIFLISAAPTDISVYGVGGNETSYLVWEVRDSVGLPIDAAHAVPVTFSLNSGLNAGEFVYPVSVTTNAQGRATTSLSSGVRAGAVQVLATVQSGGRTITSQPVGIVIHSGLADQTHFSIAATQLNFPALGIVGNRDPILVLAGDVYANPVAVNTAIYLTTRAGVVVSSTFTDLFGQGTASLISGNPFPLSINHNALTPWGEGYHYVIASTIGQNGVIVKDSVLVLWSGPSIIDSITPPFIDVPNAGSQRIDFKVCDVYGNTLSQGTTITVQATGVQAVVSFGNGGSFTIDSDINWPPHAMTHFSAFMSDALPDTTYVTPATLSISVTSEGNGNATAIINGISH